MFQVLGVSTSEEVVVRQKLTRAKVVPFVVPFLEKLALCLIGMEACWSSQPDWLRGRLAMFGLERHFGDRLFGAAVHVARGKPHPDIYLHAA